MMTVLAVRIGREQYDGGSRLLHHAFDHALAIAVDVECTATNHAGRKYRARHHHGASILGTQGLPLVALVMMR